MLELASAAHAGDLRVDSFWNFWNGPHCVKISDPRSVSRSTSTTTPLPLRPTPPCKATEILVARPRTRNLRSLAGMHEARSDESRVLGRDALRYASGPSSAADASPRRRPAPPGGPRCAAP